MSLLTQRDFFRIDFSSILTIAVRNSRFDDLCSFLHHDSSLFMSKLHLSFGNLMLTIDLRPTMYSRKLFNGLSFFPIDTSQEQCLSMKMMLLLIITIFNSLIIWIFLFKLFAAMLELVKLYRNRLSLFTFSEVPQTFIFFIHFFRFLFFSNASLMISSESLSLTTADLALILVFWLFQYFFRIYFFTNSHGVL